MNDIYKTGTESELWHIGTDTSGRYPRGSGMRPYQHVDNKDLMYDIRNYKLGKEYDEIFYKDERDEFLKKANDLNKFAKDMYESIKISNDNRPNYQKYQKNLSALSDDELRSILNRMNMEKQYSSLMTEMSPHVESGKEKIKRYLGYGVTATTAVASISTALVALSKLLDDKDEKK